MIEINLPKLSMEQICQHTAEHKTNLIYSFDVVDVSNILMQNVNAEGMGINWLTGWKLAMDYCHVNHDTVNLLCIVEDDGNFISGFNHAIQYINSISEHDEIFNWNLITQEETPVDPYKFHKTHQELIHYGKIDTYISVNKLIKQVQTHPNIFISQSKSILGSLILCCACIKDDGVAFIKIHDFNWSTLDCIVTCCALADCKLVVLPWEGYYISLSNINISVFDKNYLNIIQCLSNNTFLNSPKVINSIVSTLSPIIQSVDLKKNESWLDVEYIIALPNELSIFSHVSTN